MDAHELHERLKAAAAVPGRDGDSPSDAIVDILHSFLRDAVEGLPKATRLEETADILITAWESYGETKGQ